MLVTQTLRTEVKNVIVQMAIDGNMDGDINECLDIDEVFRQAIDNIKNDPDEHLTRLHQVQSLGEYIVDENLWEAYKRLKDARDNGHEHELAEDYVDIVEKYELSFTVSELLEEIRP